MESNHDQQYVDVQELNDELDNLSDHLQIIQDQDSSSEKQEIDSKVDHSALEFEILSSNPKMARSHSFDKN